MKLLLDESLPRLLKESLPGHSVSTVQEQGWSGTENGELLRTAFSTGFEAFITVDRGFEHQQDVTMLPVTVAILKAASNRLEDLVPLVPELIQKLAAAEPGSLISCSG